jgi:hypothetical protein
MRPKNDVMEREWKNLEFRREENKALSILLVTTYLVANPIISICFRVLISFATVYVTFCPVFGPIFWEIMVLEMEQDVFHPFPSILSSYVRRYTRDS